MNKALLVILAVSFWCGKPVFAAEPLSVDEIQQADTYVAVLRIMAKLDQEKYARASRFEWITRAEAAQGDACFLAGFEGSVLDGSCKPTEDSEFSSLTDHCRETQPNSYACNPEIFGDGICIKPNSFAWTQACGTATLEAAEIHGKTLADDLTDPTSRAKLSAYLIKNKIDLGKLRDQVTELCTRTANNGMKLDRTDCKVFKNLLDSFTKKTSAPPSHAVTAKRPAAEPCPTQKGPVQKLVDESNRALQPKATAPKAGGGTPPAALQKAPPATAQKAPQTNKKIEKLKKAAIKACELNAKASAGAKFMNPSGNLEKIRKKASNVSDNACGVAIIALGEADLCDKAEEAGNVTCLLFEKYSDKIKTMGESNKSSVKTVCENTDKAGKMRALLGVKCPK